jgi:hypothetical protein
MVGALMGAEVALTEQPELMRTISHNIATNFPASRRQGPGGHPVGAIRALPLFWSEANTRAFREESGWDAADVMVCCDCIYEPFWGDSYKALLQTVVMMSHAKSVALISVERRNGDGVDKFEELARKVMRVQIAGLDAERKWCLYVLTPFPSLAPGALQSE